MEEFKAERFYDVLGLMDRCDCLVSVDTATLHMNRSHRIPTIAFTNGSPWGSSPMVGNVVYRCPYGDVPAYWNDISNVIRQSIQREEPNPGIVLLYSDWKPKSPDTIRRNQNGFKSWPLLGARLLPYSGGRSSVFVGDPMHLPFIHDMIALALKSGTENIIAITNNDIVFDERLRQAVLDSCAKYGCYWAHRLDQPGGTTDNGVDFVAFTRKWWGLHHRFFPDFLLGSIWWDDIIARIMHWSGCHEQARLYYHEPHPGAMATRPAAPSMAHAERLAKAWMTKFGEPHSKPVDIIASL